MPTATLEAKTADFGVLAKQVREAGLLERRFGYYSVMIPLTVLAFAVGFAALILIGSSWWALGVAGFLGLAFAARLRWARCGPPRGLSLAASESSARPGRGKRVDRDELRVVGPEAQRTFHHRGGRDPDVQRQPLPPRRSTGDRTGRVARRLHDEVAGPLFFLSPVLHSTWASTCSASSDWPASATRPHSTRAALLGMHASLYLACVFGSSPPSRRLRSSPFSEAVFSVYLQFGFISSHENVALVDPGQRLWLRQPGDDLRNVGGGWFTNVALGGLNFPD